MVPPPNSGSASTAWPAAAVFLPHSPGCGRQCDMQRHLASLGGNMRVLPNSLSHAPRTSNGFARDTSPMCAMGVGVRGRDRHRFLPPTCQVGEAPRLHDGAGVVDAAACRWSHVCTVGSELQQPCRSGAAALMMWVPCWRSRCTWWSLLPTMHPRCRSRPSRLIR